MADRKLPTLRRLPPDQERSLANFIRKNERDWWLNKATIKEAIAVTRMFKDFEFSDRQFSDIASRVRKYWGCVGLSKVLPKRIYLLCNRNGLVKIGVSVDPESRAKSMQSTDQHIVLVYQSGPIGQSKKAGYALEKRLHQIFDKVRVYGEWFALESRHVDWIELTLSRYNSESDDIVTLNMEGGY